MAHSHHHGHGGHSHHHHGPAAVPTFDRAFFIAIIANGLFVICQIVFSITSHSTSLLADAIHNLGDVLGLVMAWVANSMLKRKATEKTTYGLKKSSILSALANGLMLVFSCGIIATEAMYKFFSPTEIQAIPVMIVAAIGIVVNGATAFLFTGGKDDLNIRAAFLHLLYDALISLGVVAAAALLYLTDWLWIDPVVGLLIAVIILKGTWTLFTDSLRLIVDAVPRGISSADVRAMLLEQEGVEQVHDLHIWALSTQENALSVHLLMPKSVLSDEARHHIVNTLKEKHNIQHATIQVEHDLTYCEDACASKL